MQYPNLQLVAGVILEFGRYLANTPESQRGTYMQRAERALEGLASHEIESAAEEIADRPTWPRLSRLPFEVAKRARVRQAARMLDEAPDADRCGFCDGDGWVQVLHLWHAAEVLSGGGDPQTPYTCVVCCTCQAGYKNRERLTLNKRKPIVYDPHRHWQVRSDVSLREQWDSAIASMRGAML